MSQRSSPENRNGTVRASLASPTFWSSTKSVPTPPLPTPPPWLQLEGAPPKIKWPKCDPTEMDFLSFDECELLLSNAEGVDQEMMLLAIRSGLRQGEFPETRGISQMPFGVEAVFPVGPLAYRIDREDQLVSAFLSGALRLPLMRD
jgi:hypothetical protein